ncbi:MAG: hypothetical protein HYY24_26075 [Verrucomicrobia bacterium]|nr:hypothetical protein [Verrucomicrobiota bacterium]
MKTPDVLSTVRRPVFLAVVAVLGFAWPAFATDSAAVKKLFAKPPREFSSGPLWVWNDLLTEQQIRDTMRDMAGQQVKQVFVHPRPGLMTPYLGKDWFRLWKVALNEAERLDMNVWIYDENSYPSGFAGGWVPELMPESRGRGLSLKETKEPKWEANTVAVYRIDGGRVENVSAKVKAGEALGEGRFLVATVQRAGNSGWYGGRCYVDLLYPGVTEKFIEVTHEAYRREIGQQFGKRVPGIFTDEPQIRPAGGLPWTDDLPQQFQKRWAYSLLDHLPSLNQEVGDWRRVRHNYLQVLNDLFVERWAKPNYDWCEKYGLDWTGHYWDHEWPHCLGVPDNMAMYAWHQRPAIDSLMNQYREDTHAQFGNVRMCRELLSVANQLGRARTLCEIYGAGGWDLRFEDMKRIADWLGVLGVNTFDQHLSYVTIRGARKRDHPQSFSYHAPWWDAYHVSASYLERLSVAVSQGEQINRILVLEPTTTAWMYQGNEPKLRELGDSFCKLLVALDAAQIEYDLGSEDVIARNGSVNGKELRVGKRSYPVVVVPPLTENINAAIARLGEEFLTGGGTVVCLGQPPSRVDGEESQQAAAGVNEPGWLSAKVEEAPQVLRRWSNADGFAVQRAADDKGILFHMRRQLDDGELLFLVNTSITSPSAGTVESNARGIEEWDLNTGGIEAYAFEQRGSGVRAKFELPPSGSLLLFLSKSPRPPAPPVTKGIIVVTSSSSLEIRRLAPNVLTLDYVDVTAGGETKRDVYFYEANRFAWQKNGSVRNPWDNEVQFKDELIKRTFAPGSGFEASYKFTIEGAVPKDLAIVIERTDLYTITCNGQKVAAKKGDWWLDKAFGRIALASAARTGENVVTVKASPFTMLHELEPAYVLGDFALKPTAKGFVVTPEQPLQLGKWNEQGQPFYAAGVAYRQRVGVGNPSGRYVVSLPSWYGSVAKVLVNGKLAGHVAAPPWECDVTKALKRGDNTLEVVVIGTPKNTLGPHHGKQPLGSAWPSMFQKGPPSGPPPGAEYATVGYGLFEPFVLKQVTITPRATASAR